MIGWQLINITVDIFTLRINNNINKEWIGEQPQQHRNKTP